jgi:hypothetical protein
MAKSQSYVHKTYLIRGKITPERKRSGVFYILKDASPHREPIFWLGFTTDTEAHRQQISEESYKQLKRATK